MNTSNQFEQTAALHNMHRIDPAALPVNFAGEEPDDNGGMQMLAWAFIALALTLVMVGFGLLIGRLL